MEPSTLANRPEIQLWCGCSSLEHCAPSSGCLSVAVCFPAQGFQGPSGLDSLKPQGGYTMLTFQVWLLSSWAVLSNNRSESNRCSMKCRKECNSNASLMSAGQVILPWMTHLLFLQPRTWHSLSVCLAASPSFFLLSSPLCPLGLSSFPCFHLFLSFLFIPWAPDLPLSLSLPPALLSTVVPPAVLFIPSLCSQHSASPSASAPSCFYCLPGIGHRIKAWQRLLWWPSG